MSSLLTETSWLKGLSGWRNGEGVGGGRGDRRLMSGNDSISGDSRYYYEFRVRLFKGKECNRKHLFIQK